MVTDDLIKVGIVGFGAVAQIHLEAYREVRGIKVVSIADTNPMQLAQAEREMGLRGYPTLGDMLRAESLDVVCVLTPPASHQGLVEQCAVAKVHVLCEKPLALTVESCEQMVRDCRSNGVRLCYGASYRYLPALVAAREMIHGGEIGEVLLLREYAVGRTTSPHRATLGIAHYPQGGPGGAGMGLCDHGIHLIDAFPWLIDSSTTGAWGRGNISGKPQGPEFANLEYANGAIGQLLYEDGTYTTTLPGEGAFAWGGGWSLSGDGGAAAVSGIWDPDPGCIHVHGTRGSLRIFHYANALFHRSDIGVRQVRVPDRPMPGNFALQIEAFVEAIRSGGPTPVPGEVGTEACRTLLRIYAGQGARFSGRDCPQAPP
jgi:predicted dehydrogenase